ncbi:MAG: hypothetical protein GY898_24225 [Proteobacteria bacterium]|nr:hypothetical protein [Pseudomonadota bacterium]
MAPLALLAAATVLAVSPPADRTLVPQLHDGVEVIGGGSVELHRAGSPSRVIGAPADVGPVAPRTVTNAEAEEVAREARPGSRVVHSTSLIAPLEDGYGPIVAVDLVLEDGLPARLWIAADGEPRVLRQLAVIAEDDHATGTVQVYDSSELYGDLVIRDVDELEDEHWLASFDRVVFDLAHDDPNLMQYSADDEWHWTPDQWQFSIAMGFHHLQAHERFVTAMLAPDWFPEMGDPEVAFVNIDAETFSDDSFQFRAGHAYTRDDFGNWEHNYLFGTGGGVAPGVTMANFAHDAEVWAHEQGHAIISEMTPFDDTDLRGIDQQFEAIHEGLSDYTAIAYTEEPTILEFIVQGIDDFHRPADVVRVWPGDFEDGGDPHENGRIISSMGWSLRQLIGPDAADFLMHAAPWYLAPSAADFEAFAEGMVLADEDAFGVTYVVPLIETLRAHGTWPTTQGADPIATASLVGRVAVGEPATVEAGAEEACFAGAAWALVEAPPGSEITVEGDARWGSSLTFSPDVCGPYVFEVRVASTGRQLSAPVDVEVIPCGTGCSCAAVEPPSAGAATLLLLLGVSRRRRRLAGRAASV